MRNIVILIIVIATVGLFASNAVYAASEDASGLVQQEALAITDVGNKVCPLTGEDVDGKSFYVYKGKRYGLCCPQCEDNFSKDPETYAAIAEREASGRKPATGR